MYKVPLVMTIEEFKGEKGLLIQSVEDAETLIEAG